MGTLRIAGGGFRSLLLGFLYLMALVFVNFVFSVNLLRLVYFESYHLPAEVPSAPRQGAAAYLSASCLTERLSVRQL